ncbi:MAG: hypothetical protein D6748_05070 [Calditrichaeota bacterium]|nr:MAG: hypothetical protein D6748_05070 [Calditrichota bacterium]
MKVITLVGASLFENYLENNNGQAKGLYKRFRELQNQRSEVPFPEEWQEWQSPIDVLDNVKLPNKLLKSFILIPLDQGLPRFLTCAFKRLLVDLAR